MPQSGSPYLRQYADLVLEGIRLAAEHEGGPGQRPVEVVIVDDGGDPARAAERIRELEQRGAVGVVGPLLESGIVAAARARTDSALVLISPTAPEIGQPLSNVYSLVAGDTRGAEALAAYAGRTGLRNVALLYPRTRAYQAQAQAFAAALRAGRPGRRGRAVRLGHDDVRRAAPADRGCDAPGAVRPGTGA